MHLLYKFPGPHILEDGKGYDWKVFPTVENGLAEGWFKTYWEASAKKEDAELTRAELEVLANDAGIKFDKRTTDASLKQKVTAWATQKSNS